MSDIKKKMNKAVVATCELVPEHEAVVRMLVVPLKRLKKRHLLLRESFCWEYL